MVATRSARKTTRPSSAARAPFDEPELPPRSTRKKSGRSTTAIRKTSKRDEASTSSGYESGEDTATSAATNRQLFDNSKGAKRVKFSEETEEGFEYEFGGPAGALLTTLALPVVTLLLIASASAGSVAPFISNLLHPLGSASQAEGLVNRLWSNLDIASESTGFLARLLSNPVLFPGCQDGFATLLKCMGGIVGWFLFQVVLERILPCEIVQGAPLKGSPMPGERLSYRINGHLAFWTTLLVVAAGWPSYVEVDDGTTMLQLGRAPLGLLYDYHAELALATILLCFALSAYLYLRSAADPTLLRAEGGDSGSAAYDFFLGRELNPRWGTFDWKEFCELRPGLIGWALLNMAMVVKQQEKLGYVSGSMMLINAFQGLYVWDALYQERAILTTMDITTDGFGFMLVFGDLAWVPFTYSLQARYLVDHDPHFGLPMLLLVLATNALGYCIFRGANGQKDAFRRDPDAPEVAHLRYLQTERGTRLLTSGWWGAARKINYTGDWIMGLSWCMLCGFDSVVPYYYAIYFAILLVHRSIRDDGMCKTKYGEDWEEYKRLVPYRFVPGLI